MKIFGIGDLHLSFSTNKPMDIFGPHWQDHAARIERNWQEKVSSQDIVLIPGDISWAVRYEEADPDLRFIAALPGKKVIIRGNHDYWWPSISKLRKTAPETLYFIQNDALRFPGVRITGTRLWEYPFIRWDGGLEGPVATPPLDAQTQKLQKREIERLKRCLESLELVGRGLKIVLTHFPPLGPDLTPNIITDLMSSHGVRLCVFGHIHEPPEIRTPPIDHVVKGVRYVLTSCDQIDFNPKMLMEL